MRIRSRVCKLALVLGGNVALTILLLEVVLRVVPFPSDFRTYLRAVGMIREQEDAYVRDNEIGITAFKPNRTFTWSTMDGEWSFSTIPFPGKKNLGLRDDGFNSSASRRVFALGDSFTFGFGVNDDEVWHEILEAKYRGAVDIFHVRTLGNSLSDIEEKYPLLANRFPHDTVFLCIYLGNEFIGDYRYRAARLLNSGPATSGSHLDSEDTESNRSLGTSSYHLIRKHLYVARLAKFLFFKRWIRLGYYNYDTRREVYQPPNSPFVFTIDYETDILVRTCAIEYSSALNVGVTEFVEALTKLCKRLDDEGKELFVFVFPFKEQVYWEQWESRLVDRENYDRFKPNRVVSTSLEALGVEYYDLTADLVEAGKSRVLYWPIDSHWNGEGNRIVANLIYDRLSYLDFK